MEVENLHHLLLFFTLFLTEQSSASKNTRKEIETELFQSEELMDDIPIIKTSIENLKLHAQRLFWKPKGRTCHMLGFQCGQ
jgi:hypothetical protein